MPPLIVTAAVIRKNKKVLLAQREKNSKHSLKWEFPGGKLEEGESPEQCLKREIIEELNLDIEIKDIFKVVHHQYADRDILLLCYLCNALDREIKTLECNDFKWIDIEELNNFDIVEADVTIVNKLKSMGDKVFQI